MVLLRRINQRRKPLVLVSRAFSSSSNPPFPPPPPPTSDPDAARSPSPPPPNPGAGPNPSSSLFRDIRERLKSAPTPPQNRRISMNPPRPNVSGAQTPLESLNNVRKMLQNFREPQAGGGAPSVPASNSGATPSFQDLLKTNPALRPDTPGNFDAIRNSLRNTLRITPQKRPTPATLQSPSLRSAFDREKGQKLGRVEGPGKDKDSDNELTRSYSYEELGKRLGELRPADVAKDGKDWFSLEELQGRIAKLAVLEKEEDQRSSGNIQMTEIRESIKGIKRAMHAPMPIFVGNIGTNIGLQDYLQAPPQEELLERYFHPDHMSSEEKMKLELQKVRDEFKMSENDCGSARVQIAQLTVKIKHLSSVLHKKDKHSRKGLQDMVQRRKKYLKYLRRTDWDSYCLVLSKLGLRDVPEYKAPDYKSKSTSKVKSKKSKSKSKRKIKA